MPFLTNLTFFGGTGTLETKSAARASASRPEATTETLGEVLIALIAGTVVRLSETTTETKESHHPHEKIYLGMHK